MEATNKMSSNEALTIIERMRFEEEYKNLPQRRDALDYAIQAIIEWTHYQANMMDDGK